MPVCGIFVFLHCELLIVANGVSYRAYLISYLIYLIYLITRSRSLPPPKVHGCARRRENWPLWLRLLMSASCLLLTGVFDGPLMGGTPKGVELSATCAIPDLSRYGLGSANNGGGSTGVEFNFGAGSLSAGAFVYVSSEADKFEEFFGFAPSATSGAANVNGDERSSSSSTAPWSTRSARSVRTEPTVRGSTRMAGPRGAAARGQTGRPSSARAGRLAEPAHWTARR